MEESGAERRLPTGQRHFQTLRPRPQNAGSFVRRLGAHGLERREEASLAPAVLIDQGGILIHGRSGNGQQRFIAGTSSGRLNHLTKSLDAGKERQCADRIAAMTDTSQQSLADGSGHAEPLTHLCDRPGLEREGTNEGSELGLQPFADAAGHFDLSGSHGGPGPAAGHRINRGGGDGQWRARRPRRCRFWALHGGQMLSGRVGAVLSCSGSEPPMPVQYLRIILGSSCSYREMPCIDQ